jgi:hypothetical protein
VATGASVLVTGAGVGAGGGVDATGTAGATGAGVLAVLDTAGVTGAAGAAVGVELAGVAGAGPAEPEPAPLALVREPAEGPEPGAAALGGDAAEPTAEVTGEAAEPTAEVTGDVAEPTDDVTVEEAEPTVEEAVDAVEVCFDDRGASAAVAACAGRENSSRTTKIPAAASAACIAVRAMRRTIGCDMSSSTRRETGPPACPPAVATHHARPDLLFGHHRTVLSPIRQGVSRGRRTQCGEDRQRDRGPPPPDCRSQVAKYQERAWRKSPHASTRAGRGIECVLVKTLMGTSHSGQGGGEQVNVLDLSRWQSDATMALYFFFMPVYAGIGFPLAGFETAQT